MSTFIVRFAGPPGVHFRGKVRHVGSGEEAPFGSKRDLLAFFEAMNAVQGAREEPVGEDDPTREFDSDDAKEKRPSGSRPTLP
jgi:hypothetical protein